MKKIILLSLLVSFNIQNSMGCLNAEGITIFGDTVDYNRPFRFFNQLRKSIPKNVIQEELKELKIALNKNDNPRDWVNLSVYLIYDNQVDSAIKVLHYLASKEGGSYSIYSNLGVAHELKGNIDSAYYWTERGVEENPKSHRGSEWIHLKILEAQQGLNNNSEWLKKNTVLGHKISKDSLPIKPFKNDREVRELANQIEFQLRERMYFIQPKNEIVGQLLFQLADLYSVSVDIENAIGTYLLAKQYDPHLSSVINKRLAKIKQILNPEEIQFMDSISDITEVDTLEIIDTANLKFIGYPVDAEQNSDNLVRYLFGGGLLLVLLLIVFKYYKN